MYHRHLASLHEVTYPFSSFALRSGKKFSEPRIHAFVYEPTTGEALKLPVNFKTYLHELRSIYDLYKIDTKPLDIIEEERGFDWTDELIHCL